MKQGDQYGLSEPAGMGSKLIIDAGTPVAPDRMREITMIADPPGSAEAAERLQEIWKTAVKV